jgi:hypothetical protein
MPRKMRTNSNKRETNPGKMVFKKWRKEQEGMRPKWKQIRQTTALLFVKARSKLSYITRLYINFVSGAWVQLSSLLFYSQVPFSHYVKNSYYHTILIYIKLVHLHFQKKFIWHVLNQGQFLTCSVIQDITLQIVEQLLSWKTVPKFRFEKPTFLGFSKSRFSSSE